MNNLGLDPTWLWIAGTAIVAVAALLVWVVVAKGRPFTDGDVFRASRMSAGNRLFPTQVAITKDSVVQYKPKWIGHSEEVIHVAHIASVKISTGAMPGESVTFGVNGIDWLSTKSCSIAMGGGEVLSGMCSGSMTASPLIVANHIRPSVVFHPAGCPPPLHSRVNVPSAGP